MMRTAIYVVGADPAYAVFDCTLELLRLDELEKLAPKLRIIEHGGEIVIVGDAARDARLILSGKPYSGCDIFHGEAGNLAVEIASF